MKMRNAWQNVTELNIKQLIFLDSAETPMHNIQLEFTDKFPKDGLKGFCTFMNKTKYVVINDRLSSIEARVVAGHEAGHIIRHATELKVGAFQDNDIYREKGARGECLCG